MNSPFRGTFQSITASGMARGGAFPWENGGGAGLDLVEHIFALLGKGTSGGVQALFVASEANIAHVANAVSSWTDLTGLGRTVTQGTGTSKPTWDPALFGGRGGLSFDGGDSLVKAGVDLTAFERGLIMCTFFDSQATLGGIVDHAGVANGRISIVTNDPAGSLSCFAFGAATSCEAQSANTHSMASAACVASRVDYTLTSNSTSIWKDGVDITDSRPSDANMSAHTLANGALWIGDLVGGGNGLIGKIRHVLVAAWPSGTAYPNAAIARVDQLLRADAGIA